MGLLSDAVAEFAELVTLRHRPSGAGLPDRRPSDEGAASWWLARSATEAYSWEGRPGLEPRQSGIDPATKHPTLAVISIFRCSDYIQAQLLTGLLAQHGIGVFLQGALLQGGLGELPALGHLSIMVDDSDRAAAEQIIAAYERGDLKIDEEDVEQPVNDSDTT